MTVKDYVLEALSTKGDFLSGGELASTLGVSRNAVWKAVKALEAEGCVIESVTGRGYRLTGGDVLSGSTVERLAAVPDWHVQVYDTLPSTNRTAKMLAEQGAAEGTVVIAASQTEGRGRLGRAFCSPPDTGLYMSVVLRPQLEAHKALMITVAAAVAVCRAVEEHTDLSPRIKWVNDIYCRDRKVCGILTEASLDAQTGLLDYAVLGIGINVREPKGGFPADIAAIAGALFEDENGADRNRIAATVLRCFAREYARLEEEAFVAEYRRRSMLNGRSVTVTTPLGSISATALDVDEACRLRVRYDDGREETLSSGDVSIRME